MKTNGNRTRMVAGKRYTDYGKQDLAVLASARRWLNSHAGMCEQSAFTPEEADRRVLELGRLDRRTTDVRFHRPPR